MFLLYDLRGLDFDTQNTIRDVHGDPPYFILMFSPAPCFPHPILRLPSSPSFSPASPLPFFLLFLTLMPLFSFTSVLVRALLL